MRPTPGGNGCRCPAREAHSDARTKSSRRGSHTSISTVHAPLRPARRYRSIGVGRKLSPKLLQTTLEGVDLDLRLDPGMTGAVLIPSRRRILLPSPIQGTSRRIDPWENAFQRGTSSTAPTDKDSYLVSLWPCRLAPSSNRIGVDERGIAIADIARRHRLNTVRFQDGYVNLRCEGRTCARSARVGQPTVNCFPSRERTCLHPPMASRF